MTRNNGQRKRRLSQRLMVATWIIMMLLIGCAEETPDSSEGISSNTSIVPPGKADNYFSTAAQEYTLTGRTSAQIEDTCLVRHEGEDDSKYTCQREIIGLKNFALAWFINQYVSDKHDTANEDWGGFTAMTRPDSFEALEVTEAADGSFEYTFTSELSGPFDLLSKMSTEPCDDNKGARCFTLEVPVLASSILSQMNTGAEWYRRSPYSEYSPETYSGEKEKIVFEIEAFPRSNDAFLEYGKLFDEKQLALAGGKLRVGVFVGWDYYEDRYDLQTAKEVYRWLTDVEGFTSPSKDYDSYTINSGDFTKTIKVEGKEIEVEVRLVHPGQGDPGSVSFAGEMKSAMIDAFHDRQIIIYEGHAGPLYGFALGNWRKTEAGELDDSELPGLDIPADFYQVVLASGCDTYMVADSLYQNPVKIGRVDLDIITTSSFSNAAGKGRTAKALMSAVFNQDASNELEPRTYGSLLRVLNSERWMTPLYGVHGIDDNPRDNPFADKSLLCQTCESSADCGGNGSLCTQISNEQTVCTTLCQTDADCPDGNTCWDVSVDVNIVSSQCAPDELVCE